MKKRKLSIVEKKGNESANRDCWKKSNLSNIVLNKNKKSGEKQRWNYISNIKKQNEELKLKVKLFTNKNQKLETKINESAEVMAKDESEGHLEESGGECDFSREILDNLSPALKKHLTQGMSLSKSISSTVRKVLRLDRAGKGQKYK